jgi:hypothetical protein
MSNDLEFHYVVSYRQGIGWGIAVDTEDALFNEGTIYDWENDSWDVEIDEVETIDLEHYRMLNSALRLLNEGAINA